MATQSAEIRESRFGFDCNCIELLSDRIVGRYVAIPIWLDQPEFCDKRQVDQLLKLGGDRLRAAVQRSELGAGPMIVETFGQHVTKLFDVVFLKHFDTALLL